MTEPMLDFEPMLDLFAGLEPKPMDPLFVEQLHLEDNGRDRGIQRFWDKAMHNEEREAATSNAPVAGLYAELVEPLEAKLKAWLKATRERRQNATRSMDEDFAADFVEELGAGRVAIVAARVICDRIASLPATQASLMRPIADGMRDEWAVHVALKREPHILDDVQRRMKGANARIKRSYAASSAKRALKRMEERYEIPRRIRDNIGFICIKLMLECWPVITQVWMDRGIGRHKALAIGLAPEAAAWMGQVMDKRQDLHPPRPHMVVPPARHDTGDLGGYVGALRDKVPITKPRNPEKASEMSELTLRTISDLAETPLVFNPTILEEWKAATQHSGKAGFPVYHDIESEIPPYPTMGLTPVPGDSPEAKAWKKKVQILRNEGAVRASAAFEVAEALAEVERMEKYEQVYSPIIHDFRGRLYAATSALSYQGAKCYRSIYRFKNKKALGPTGARHLAIHLANSMDDCRETGLKLSKTSFDVRMGWVENHAAIIEETARDSASTYEWWSKADDPWALLAACKEWAGYVREGEDYETGLPIAYDGTCNGLQHYGALLRDRRTAASVNLVPSETPSDVYVVAADMLQQRTKDKAMAGDENAMFWLSQQVIGRSLVKGNVMTLPYGVTEYGAAKQLMKELRKKGIGCDAPQRQWLAEELWQVIASTVPAATTAMDWLRKIAAAIAETNQPITWTVPTGSRIVQTSPISRSVQIKTRFHGKYYAIATRELILSTEDGFKACNGLPPNLVHSLDATHLTLTARSMIDQGVRDLLFIHDSYAALPADCDTLNRTLRRTFVDMYQENVWEQLVDQLLAQLPPGFDPGDIPQVGDFDIQSVLESPYFFA